MKKRLFIGTLVPIAEEVESVIEAVSKLGIEGKWVEEKNLHFTYRFLGDIETEKIPSIVRFLRSKLSGKKAPTVRYRGLGVFPNFNRPRVLWVRVESEELLSIKEAVDSALQPFGFPKEENFLPHLTLLRIKKMRRRVKFKELLVKFRNHTFAERVESGVCLIESKLTREGPVYTVLEEFRLD